MVGVGDLVHDMERYIDCAVSAGRPWSARLYFEGEVAEITFMESFEGGCTHLSVDQSDIAKHLWGDVTTICREYISRAVAVEENSVKELLWYGLKSRWYPGCSHGRLPNTEVVRMTDRSVCLSCTVVAVTRANVPERHEASGRVIEMSDNKAMPRIAAFGAEVDNSLCSVSA